MTPRSYSLRCVVIGKTKLGETDAIVTMLGQDGHQVRAVAKGLRKPGSRFGARLEPYSVVDVHLHRGRSLDIVSEVRTFSTNAACREDLDKSSACACVAEFLAKSTRDADTEERVFRLTQTCFDAIGKHDASVSALLAAAHLIKAYAMMGFAPALRECALCGEPVGNTAGFDLSAGGALCDSCSVQTASQDASVVLRWLEALLYSSLDDVAAMEGAPVRQLLDFCESWAAEHLSLKMRSIAFLKALY